MSAVPDRLAAAVRAPTRAPLPPVAVAAVAAVAAILVALLAVVLPLPVVLGANRLVGFGVLTLGAWLLVGRLGFVDLATGASAGAGAYAGGVLAGVAGFPAVLGLITGAAAGAAVSGLSAAVGGRVGRAVGALTSLAIGGAVVAVLRAWPGAGGASGYHAVPLLTPGDRTDLLAGLLLLAAAALVVRRAAATVTASAAATAAGAPEVAAGLGRRPARDAVRVGAVAGAVLGLGGALQAALTGSVAPGGYGLSLSAALVLAALLGGATPAGPVLGALLLWGPGIVWPLVPLVGDAPVLLTTGVAGLALLAARRGRPLVGWRPRDPIGSTAPQRPRPGRAGTLAVPRTRLPGGDLELEVAPGEVVVLVGPNGSGKSTLLARIAGQLTDDATVRVDGRGLPRGAARRARTGVVRTWQRPPDVAPGDALAAAIGRDRDGHRRAAAAWARDLLGAHADTAAGAQLVRLAAARPAVALLDEPAGQLPVERVGALVRGLAEGGAAVLVVEHRPEAVALGDRVVRLGG